MEKSIFINNAKVILVFALIFAAFISSIRAINIGDYLTSSESMASVQQVNTTTNGTVYTLVQINGVDSFIINNGTIVQDRGVIALALNSFCFDTSYPTNNELNELNTLLLAFNQSRQQTNMLGPVEAYCDANVGQNPGNVSNCYDINSCMDACSMGSWSCWQEEMNDATFSPPLLDYANEKRGINNALQDVLSTTAQLESVSSASQISFNVADKLNAISSDISNLQSNSTAYESNPLFAYDEGFCVPSDYTVTLNDSALSSASTIVAGLLTGSSCFNNINSKTTNLLNQTLTRVNIYETVNSKTVVQADFSNVSSRYLALSQRANAINSVINDSQISQYTKAINNIETTYTSYYNNGNFNMADQTVKEINAELNDFETYVNSTYAVFNPVINNETEAANLLAKGAVVIEPSDASMSAALSKLQQEYNVQAASLRANLTKDNAQTYTAKFEGIANQTSVLITQKQQQESQAVPQVLSDTMRSISVTVLNSISGPLGIQEADKRAWIVNIPIIIIALIDVIILAVCSVVFFFFLVRNASKFSRSAHDVNTKVLKGWEIILVVFILLLAGLSYATYYAFVKETSSASIYSFLAQVKSDPKVTLFVERQSSNDPTAINGCASQIQSKFQSIGVNVTEINVVDGVCNNGTLSACLANTPNPFIQLQYSNSTNTTFYTFYKPEGAMTGNSTYFSSCLVSQLIG